MALKGTFKEPGWTDATGSESGIVLSSRIRLARNLKGHSFTHRANPDERAQVFEQIRNAIREARGMKRARVIRLDRTSSLDRQFLLERHLISPDLAKARGPRGVVFGARELFSIMINEEDHMRIQGVFPGFELMKAWNGVDRLDEDLNVGLDVAFSPRWGYLTACPTNTGTGLRASVLIHLPGLALTKQIGKVLRGISQVGLAIRGMFGEGSEVMGNFFQVSNQTTLGLSEEEVIEKLTHVTRQIIDHEKSASDVLMKNARLQVEDKVYRAYGILRHCRVISSQEVIGLVSALRFGQRIGLLKRLDNRMVNRLMLYTLPGHLQRESGGKMERGERDFRRAEMVRRFLGEELDKRA